MVDSVSTLKPFTTVNYTTKDGEHISATKNNGIVTLVGDKNGTRQMPIDDFMKELIENAPQLEKSPEKDTVELSKTPETKTETKPEIEEKTTQPVVQADKNEAAKAPEVGKKLDIAA